MTSIQNVLKAGVDALFNHGGEMVTFNAKQYKCVVNLTDTFNSPDFSERQRSTIEFRAEDFDISDQSNWPAPGDEVKTREQITDMVHKIMDVVYTGITFRCTCELRRSTRTGPYV